MYTGLIYIYVSHLHQQVDAQRIAKNTKAIQVFDLIRGPKETTVAITLLRDANTPSDSCICV